MCIWGVFFRHVNTSNRFLTSRQVFLSLRRVSGSHVLPPHRSVLFRNLHCHGLFSFLPYPSLVLFRPVNRVIFRRVRGGGIVMFGVFLSGNAVGHGYARRVVVFYSRGLRQVVPIVKLVCLLVVFRFRAQLVASGVHLPVGRQFPTRRGPSTMVRFLVFFQ